MDSLALLAIGVIAVLILQVIVLIRGFAAAGRLRGLEQRLVELEGAAKQLPGISFDVTAIKEGTGGLVREVAESRGRLAGIVEGQAQIRTAVTELQQALPLQLSQGLAALIREIGERHDAFRQEVAAREDDHRRSLSDQLSQNQTALLDALSHMRREVTTTLTGNSELLATRMEELRTVTDTKLGEILAKTAESAQALNETATRTIAIVTDRLGTLKEGIEQTLKAELGAIRTENAGKLEEMRRTVDEKLHATLEQRLGESFKQVSERLESVHRGLGEMQSLATGVGDLKKVLTNVKTRGTWGEVQLEALLEQILTPEQFGKNVETKPGSGARVEFAIRLPGRGETEVVWLPVDAKFPMEDYQRLVEAQERADLQAIEEAGRALEQRIRTEARAIRDRYVEPPHTTDFAILYLPTEGLYAEVLRRIGVAEWCQRECKVNLAGPTTLAALLNSLQMGFRTLAIEKRSSEVWTVLGAVKTEFGRFGDALAHTKKKLEEATNSLEKTEQRNRVLGRKLKDVDALPAAEAAAALETEAALALPAEFAEE